MLSTSTEFAEIAAALAKAQGAMQNAIKDAMNPAFKTKYANLAAVRDAVNGPLSANGIACLQAPMVTELGVSVETRLIHTSGQWFACTVAANPKDGTPQSIGSAITYLRRYGLLALCGIAPDDDDGAASQPPHGQSQPLPRQQAPAGQGHSPDFTDADRKAFMSALSKRHIAYEDVKAYCAFRGNPKPSEMTVARREKLVQFLDSPEGVAAFTSFLDAKADTQKEQQ